MRRRPSRRLCVYSVPSLSPVSTVDSRGSTPPPGQTLDFRRTVPLLPSTYTLLQSNSDVRTPHPRLRHICLMDPSLPLFLAPLLTPFRRLLHRHTPSPRLSPACENLVSRLMFSLMSLGLHSGSLHVTLFRRFSPRGPGFPPFPTQHFPNDS